MTLGVVAPASNSLTAGGESSNDPIRMPWEIDVASSCCHRVDKPMRSERGFAYAEQVG